MSIPSYYYQNPFIDFNSCSFLYQFFISVNRYAKNGKFAERKNEKRNSSCKKIYTCEKLNLFLLQILDNFSYCSIFIRLIKMGFDDKKGMDIAYGEAVKGMFHPTICTKQ